jgi:hypothetical protein
MLDEWGNNALVASAPRPAYCIEKCRLLTDFASAVSEYNRMQSSRVAAVLRVEEFLFEAELAQAAMRRDEAKYAVLAHQEEHGC